MKIDGICELKLNSKERATNECTRRECMHCAWNSEEHLRRTALLHSKGLTRCKDGFKRLILAKHEDNV